MFKSYVATQNLLLTPKETPSCRLSSFTSNYKFEIKLSKLIAVLQKISSQYLLDIYITKRIYRNCNFLFSQSEKIKINFACARTENKAAN